MEQWQRPEEEAPQRRAASSTELHFRLKEEERGGFPAEDWERFVSWKPDESEAWMVLSASPVRDDMNEFAAEIDGEGEKLIVVADSFLSAGRKTATFVGWVRLRGWAWLLLLWGRGGKRRTGVGQ